MRSWNEAPAARARRNGQLCGVCGCRKRARRQRWCAGSGRARRWAGERTWRRSETFCRFLSDPLAEHRTAADGCAPVRQPLGYTLTVPQSVTLQLRSRNSKALKQEVYRKTAALAQDDQRDAALAVGRLGGGASDGAGPAGQQFIACELASPLPRPSHVCTPPAPVRASPTAADATQLTVSSRVCCRCLVPAAHDW